jgi:hypothetical protein
MSHYFTTPIHGSQTLSYVAFGSRTPMHDGSRTTHYGNMITVLYQYRKRTVFAT